MAALSQDKVKQNYSTQKIQVMADEKLNSNGEQKKPHQVHKEKEAGERGAAKKEQQKDKVIADLMSWKPVILNYKKKYQQKPKKVNEKNEPRVKNQKKNKEKKNEYKCKGNKRAVNQSNQNNHKGCIRMLVEIFFFLAVFLMTLLGSLYIVDIERYRIVRDLGMNTMNSVVYLLPTGVITKGQEVVDYMKPGVEVVVHKLRILVNQMSTVLNTNPVLKDHWSNINEISAVLGERIAEYMRTVYNQIPIYYDNAKNKLF